MAPKQQKALINCDTAGAVELLPVINIANIAYEFHGSDPLIMMETIRSRFWTTGDKLPSEELPTMTIYQIEKATNDLGVEFWVELYGGVKYDSNSMLVIFRKKKPWDLGDVEKYVRQQIEQATATDGSVVRLSLKNYSVSICCHSDLT
ncbi:hypothetical protein EYZ11_005883 [Aspergillus tanneri]|uniref:Uncharacterized protein n=1 Tax=Aspergillus tanneri TaxID=1220188 RepID=A0A4S3JJA9_9EURO|nr:hypothetical protein EYZ11_005883 [Aspergillus tanneri]